MLLELSDVKDRTNNYSSNAQCGRTTLLIAKSGHWFTIRIRNILIRATCFILTVPKLWYLFFINHIWGAETEIYELISIFQPYHALSLTSSHQRFYWSLLIRSVHTERRWGGSKLHKQSWRQLLHSSHFYLLVENLTSMSCQNVPITRIPPNIETRYLPSR